MKNYDDVLENKTIQSKEIEVIPAISKLNPEFNRQSKLNDLTIARKIYSIFKWSWNIPHNKLIILVKEGVVTLKGSLMYKYQREAAYKKTCNLMGIHKVKNNISLKNETCDELEKRNIEQALEFNSFIGEHAIFVTVADHKAILNGVVDSEFQKDEVEIIARNTQGVLFVNNNLVVDCKDVRLVKTQEVLDSYFSYKLIM